MGFICIFLVLILSTLNAGGFTTIGKEKCITKYIYYAGDEYLLQKDLKTRSIQAERLKITKRRKLNAKTDKLTTERLYDSVFSH